MAPAGIAFKKIGEFFAKPSGIIVLVIIAVLAYVYFKGKSSGKKKAVKDLKKDLQVDVDPNLLKNEQGETWEPKVITDRIYKDIYSGPFTLRDVEVYKILLSMPDERVKAVANDWLDRYFDEDQETLRVAISREKEIADWGDVKNAVMAKLTNLGIQ